MEDNAQSSGNLTAKASVWLIVCAFIVLGFFLYASRGEEATHQEPMKLGFIGPLTGEAAKRGQDAQAAVAIAVEEINAGGGVAERPLGVIYEDGKCNGADAVNAANKLITEDKVSVILGGVCSEETLALAETAAQNKTVVLSSCSSAPAVTEAGDYIFRNYPSDFFQGVFAADYLYETLGKRNAAVLYEKTEWGIGVKDAFILHFTNLGSGVIALAEGYISQDAPGMQQTATRIKSANPDAVYVVGGAEASVPILRLLQETGLQAPIFGSDRWDDARLWTAVGSAGDGALYPLVATALDDQFAARMQAETGGDEFAVCSAAAYDAVKILAQIMGRVGTASEAIKNELYKIVYTDGISSPRIGFDGNGDLVGANYTVKMVKDGKAEALQ